MSYHSPQSSKNESESNSQILMIIGIFLTGSVLIYLLFNLLINSLISMMPIALEQKIGAAINHILTRNDYLLTFP